MDSQVQSAITSCLLCQSNDKTAHTNPAPLQPVPLPDGPWKKLGLDIVGPFDTAIPACRYVITLTDYYSKWPELAFSPYATTDDVIQFLSSVFSRHGNPENIITDNGAQFTSVMFTSFLQNRGISHSRTSVYYPAANGAIERFHRALRTCIQTSIQQSKPWKATVLDWLQVYCATPHATTSLYFPLPKNSCVAGRCVLYWMYSLCLLLCLHWIRCTSLSSEISVENATLH